MKKISKFLYTAEDTTQVRKDVEKMVENKVIPWLLVLYLYDKFKKSKQDKEQKRKDKLEKTKQEEQKHREEVAQHNKEHKEKIELVKKQQEEKEKARSKKATSGDENPQMHEIDTQEPLIPGGNDDKYRTMKPMLYPDVLDHKEFPYDYDIRMG